jgi:hypothetical protein
MVWVPPIVIFGIAAAAGLALAASFRGHRDAALPDLTRATSAEQPARAEIRMV